MRTKVENRLNINEKEFEITLQNNIPSTDEEMKINVVEKKPAFLTNRSPLKNSEDGESSSEEDVVSWLKESQRSLVAVKRMTLRPDDTLLKDQT